MKATVKMAAKIDRAGSLDVQIKELNKELKELKAEIVEEGESRGADVLQGKVHTVVLVPATTTTVDKEKLYIALKKNVTRFIELVSPSVPKCRKVLTTEVFEDISVQKASTTRVHFGPSSKSEDELRTEILSKARAIDL